MAMRRAAGAFMILSLLLTVGTAEAQDEDSRVDEARTAFDHGDAHYAAGRYGLAALDFQTAFDLLTEAGHPRALLVLFNLGRTLEHIPGREAEAQAAYRRVIDESPRTPEFESSLQNARVGLRELDARMGSSERGPSDGTTASPIGPIVMGIGGATLVAGVIVAGVLAADNDAFFAMCIDGVCPTGARPAAENVQALATVTDVFLVSGAAIVATGLLLMLLVRHDPEDSPVAAGCGADRCDVLIRGIF